jgi:hypothetical protein
MKTIGTLLLIVMLFSSNGCMTYSSVQRAQGNGGKCVVIGPSDQVIQYDGTNCVIRRVSQKGETNEMRLNLVTPQIGTGRQGETIKIKPNDQIIRCDGKDCVIKRIGANGETNEIHLTLACPEGGYRYMPGYYALLPLTIPADIATFPFQLIFFMIAAGSGTIG